MTITTKEQTISLGLAIKMHYNPKNYSYLVYLQRFIPDLIHLDLVAHMHM